MKYLYEQAWQRYLDTKENMELESNIGNTVNAKLQALARTCHRPSKSERN